MLAKRLAVICMRSQIVAKGFTHAIKAAGCNTVILEPENLNSAVASKAGFVFLGTDFPFVESCLRDSRDELLGSMVGVFEQINPKHVDPLRIMGLNAAISININPDRMTALLTLVPEGWYLQTRILVSEETKKVTDREWQVVEHVVIGGKTVKQAAEDLHISTNTAKAHMRNIMEKLGIKTRTELAEYAIENKRPDPSPPVITRKRRPDK